MASMETEGLVNWLIRSPLTTSALFFGGLIVLTILRSSIKALTRGKYRAAPRVTLKGKLINFALWPQSLMKKDVHFKKLTLEHLKKQAAKKTKLNDFGDTWFERSYEDAIEMMDQAFNFSPLGQYIAYDSMVRRLEARLRVKNELKECPAALETPLVPPVFVLGLPRTGTTFLHRLLSLDPKVRCPRTWELFDPARLPKYRNDPVKDAKKRRDFVQAGVDRIKSIIPHIEAIHEIGADEPEECLVSMGMDMPLVFCTMPAFMRRKEILWKFDMTQVYTNHYKVLQLLSYQSNTQDKRWVLKCPMHLGYIDTIRRVFKGSRIIWTHRDPCQSIPSLSSLFQTMIEMHQEEDVALDEVGQTTLSFWAEMLKRAGKDVKQSNENLSHVQYKELVSDPISTVKKIYANFGWEFTSEYEDILVKYIADNRKKREQNKKTASKLHSYSLEQYGLSEEKVNKEMQWYKDQYLKA